MSSENESLRRCVEDQCERLKRLLQGIAPPPPDHHWLLNRLPTVDQISTDAEAAAEVLRMLMLDLKHRADGVGGVILSGDRYARYFEADGQL